MSVIHTPKRPELDARILIFPIAIAILLLTTFFRLWYFQVVLSPELTQRADYVAKGAVSHLAPRGLIFDREGNLLAGVKPALVVTGIPADVKKNPQVLETLANLLGTTTKKLSAKLNQGKSNRHYPTPIYVGTSVEIGSKIADSSADLPGIGVDTQPMRYYPDTLDFTHVLGNVWVPDPKDETRLRSYGVEPSTYVGKFGVEWFYEPNLMGSPGTELRELDRKGRPVRVVSRDNALPGTQLVLGIDSNLQKIADAALKGRRGAVAAVDPETGEILCLYSSPSFDLGQFEGGISVDNFKALLNDPNKPFQNRAVNGFYAPGSTFKIVTSLAMFETGRFDPSQTVYCDGAFHITKHAKVRCLGVHGAISYTQALEKSCNTYFCTMGYACGAEAIHKAGEELGLGDRTGIDLRSETNGGVVPTPDWKERHRLGSWYGGDTANMAIGQGYVLTSPLQMADVAAWVATRGTIYKPHLVRAMRAPGQKAFQRIAPVMAHHVDAPDSFWRTLVNAMVGVVDVGTARSAQIPGVEWAGKTGSAEHSRADKTHSWFIGFAPADHPRIAIAVLVESAGHGSDVAAPIARDVVRRYLLDANAASKASLASLKP